jgi:NifU-like protein involved in Fe-S cluster formation
MTICKKNRGSDANPQNRGEMKDADAIGTVGNAECGDLLRGGWFKEERGKVIDRASFQSFGCETPSQRPVWRWT